MQSGIVLYFDRFRLFGFLEGADGKDYWFHASKINLPGPWAARKVKQGEAVTFEIGINPKRGNEIAVNVAPIAPAERGSGQ